MGGGSGGVSMAAKFSKIIDPKQIMIVEPNKTHYYQPGFTLIGGGLKNMESFAKKQEQIIPKNVILKSDAVTEFEPDKNIVSTQTGDKIVYDFMIIAMGLSLNYEKVSSSTR